MASPSSVLTLGLGSWGDPSLLLTLGFGIGAQLVLIPSVILSATARPLVLESQPRPLTIVARANP